MYVVAMNRLRGAYADLDPDVERYFLASINDDEAGLDRTYSFMRRRSVSHLVGRSGVLITVVTAVLLGLLAGGVVLALEGSTVLAVVVCAVLAVLHLFATLTVGAWAYRTAWRGHVPLRRTPGGISGWTPAGRRRGAPPSSDDGQ